MKKLSWLSKLICLLYPFLIPALAQAQPVVQIGSGGPVVQMLGDMFYPTHASWADEFLTLGVTNGLIGTMGWNLTTIGGSAPTVTTLTAEANHPGILRVTTAAVANTGGAITLGASVTQQQTTGLGNTIGWDSFFVFRLNQTTTQRVRVGFINDWTTAPPITYIGVRYDTTGGIADTQYMFQCNNAGTSTVTASGVNANTSFHTFRMRSTIAGTVLFSIDGAAEIAIASNCPTGGLTPAFAVMTDSAAVSTDIDFHSFRWITLSR